MSYRGGWEAVIREGAGEKELWKPVSTCFTYGRCTFVTPKKASLEVVF